MSETRDKPPGSVNHLRSLTDSVAKAKNSEFNRVQRAVANTIVGQMLPPGVVKGGTAMKLRVGEASSRFTPDLDAARAHDLTLEEYLDALGERLRAGWNGFTGTVRAIDPPQPEGVPPDYVMTPYEIKLAYKSRAWLTVRFELGRDEVGSTLVAEPRMAEDIAGIFAALGLPPPEPIPLLAVEHQIAQKLHACTSVDPATGENERAHDLVDLQILEQEEEIDYRATAVTARRLFESRRAQTWPPIVEAFPRWPAIYLAAADGLSVLQTVEAAVDWANDLVAQIDAA